jgi:uncharacterized membrane protein
MPDFDELLVRWRNAGVLDAQAEARIRAFEDAQEEPGIAGIAGIRWQGIIALILGGILLACGVALFVSAHWDELGPGARYTIVFLMVAVFHLAGGFARERYFALSTTLHAVGTLATGAAIALVGQIFNIQDHWPAAVLMWALAALAGWWLLQDQVQQTIALLLIPAWMFSELAYYMERQIGSDVYIGRALFLWAILYLTFFVRSERKVVQGTLFAVAAVAAVIGTEFMTTGWISFSSEQTFIPFSVRFWAWVVIAALPLVIAAFHGHKGLIPIALGIVYAIVLPWCTRTWTRNDTFGTYRQTYTGVEPNLAAHAVIALFAVFLCYWGVRLASRALVNLSVVYFAIAVARFYFSDIFNKVDRSVGLIGLGVLFLAGGWMLEKTRRRLMSHMSRADNERAEAQ